MNTDYYLLINGRLLGHRDITVEHPGGSIFEDLGSYFDSELDKDLSFYFNRSSTFFFQLEFNYMIESLKIYADKAISLYQRIQDDDFNRIDPNCIFILTTFLNDVIFLFKSVSLSSLKFSTDDHGFLRLANFLSLYIYSIHEINMLNSFLDVYHTLPKHLQKVYFGFDPFKSYLYYKNGKSVVKYEANIPSFIKYDSKVVKFCKTLIISL